MFVFKMPTLEYKNKTWSWLNFVDQIKKGIQNYIYFRIYSIIY